MGKTEIRLEVFNLSNCEWGIINPLCKNGYSVFLTPNELKDKIGVSGCSFLSGKLNNIERKFVDNYYNSRNGKIIDVNNINYKTLEFDNQKNFDNTLIYIAVFAEFKNGTELNENELEELNDNHSDFLAEIFNS